MKKIVSLVVFSLLFGIGSSIAAGVILPENVQAIMLVKILKFTKSYELKIKPDEPIIIGILYKDKYDMDTSKLLLKAFLTLNSSGTKIDNHKLDFCLMQFTDEISLTDNLKTKKVNVLFCNLREKEDALKVAAVSRKTGTLSVVAVENSLDFVKGGIASIGLTVDSDKPTILVNKKTSLQEGYSFTDDFLSLVKVFE